MGIDRIKKLQELYPEAEVIYCTDAKPDLKLEIKSVEYEPVITYKNEISCVGIKDVTQWGRDNYGQMSDGVIVTDWDNCVINGIIEYAIVVKLGGV